MIDDGSDGFTLIGLHKLAARNGEGRVPELYELLMRRAEEQQQRAPNVTFFPSWKARRPGDVTDRPLDHMTRDGANIVAFAPGVDKIVARRKRV